MLDTLRRGASGWLSKLILGLIIVSFVAFGITSRTLDGGGPGDALGVGWTKISAAELDQQYRRALDGYSAQVGHPLTKEEALRYGLPNQILTQIVARTTLTEEARRLGLAVSDNAVRQMIVADPALKGSNGQFDRNILRNLLYQNRITEDDYITDRRAEAMRQQVLDAMVGGLKPPAAMLEMLNQYSQEERTVTYVAIEAASLGEIADPAPDVLAKFFDERKAAFKSAEMRQLQLVTLDPAKISNADMITDDEARAIYTKDLGRYTTPEKRRIQQIPFDSKEAADAAAKRLADGLGFDALVTEMKLKPDDIDQGLLEKKAFIDPAVADAAFKIAKAGDVSGVIAGKFRNVIIRVSEITPEAVAPFEAIAPAIKTALAATRSTDAVRTMMKSIESARDERASLADIATRFKLDIVTAEPITRDGRTADGKPLEGVAAPERLAKAAFESDLGNQNDPLTLDNGGYLFFDVTKILPPRDRTLEEVKAEITQRWKAEQIRTRLADKAKDIVARLEKGESFEDVAKSADLELKTSASFKRSDTPEGLSPAAVTAAFNGGEGAVSTALTPTDGRIVMQVKDINQPAFFAEAESLKQPAEQFNASLKTTLENEVLRRIQADAGLTVNQQVVSQIVGLPMSPN